LQRPAKPHGGREPKCDFEEQYSGYNVIPSSSPSDLREIVTLVHVEGTLPKKWMATAFGSI
jgi:hypothetical protein